MRARFTALPLRLALLATASAAVLLAASPAFGAPPRVGVTSLVTDDQAFLATQGFKPAVTQDANLINPWGMSFGPTSPFWISDQGAGKATLYNASGGKIGLTVTIPGSPSPPTGPTGQVFNPTTDFVLPADGAKANFIFANLDGTISGWNNGLGTNAAVAARTPGAIYTGLAMGSSGGHNFLYAANAGQGRVDVYDSAFMLTLSSGFVDPSLPAGLAPFNIANIGGQLYVTYAPPVDADEAPLGTGVVDIFGTDGTFVRRFATGGQLLSPWGMAHVPDSFGFQGGRILIGNFADEDGFINSFRESDGAYMGMLANASGGPLKIPYLWSLAFGNNGVGADPDALYFTAGIGDEEHGLFGRLNVVPEPATWALLLAGFGLAGCEVRRRTAQPLPG